MPHRHAVPELRTDRLLLRPWRDADRDPFAAINADPVVMEHFQATMSRAESDRFVDRNQACWDEHGWGLWAVEVTGTAVEAPVPFIGYVGLWPADHLPGAPLAEVGWRLARAAWGHGYAPEAATAAMRFAVEEVGFDEIVSFTVPQNRNSWRVMEKIGLRRAPRRDFDHPRVDPVAHPHLVRHIFYELPATEWRGAQADGPASTSK